MDNHAFRAVNEVARRFPRTIPRLNRFASAVASQRERIDWSHAIFASERLVRFEEMEYSVPREHAVPAVRAARAALERHPVSFPVELRFTAGDDALLSPAHGRDSAFVAVHVFRGMPYEPAFREVEAALSELGGRPHWGKRSFLSAAELAPRYPRWDAFQAVRAELDPSGRFANAWVRDVLG
jgi:L-gulonolactone oxidase